MVCSHYYYHHQSQQTTIFPETAQESGGSSPTINFCIFTPCILEYWASVWHYAITRLQTEHLESIQKRAIHIIYPFTRSMSYSNILFVAELTSLECVTNFQRHSFKTSVTHPLPSIIYSPPSTWYICLVSAQNSHTVTRPISRTKNIVPLLITP